MNKQKYIGITVGPIVKTLMLTTTPAGLWGASYIFSYFTKILIKQLEDCLKIPRESFLVPVSNNIVDNIIESCPWAGLFHDRIIFRVNNSYDLLGKVDECIKNTKDIFKEKIIDSFLANESNTLREEAKKYIKEYLQVQAIEKEIYEGSNPILELSQPLDVLELGQEYISNEAKNYILDFLENRDSLEQKKTEYRNQNIKNFIKKIQKDDGINKNWHFLENEKIITIDDIAGVDRKTSNANAQTKNYFALVKADGDNLGKVLKNMEGSNVEANIKNFSEKCFSYANKAFDIVEQYGGKMIYAGGDDILFIAPVKKNEETVFHLIRKLNDKFIEKFKDFSFKEDEEEKKMGFSAGVMICYYKYPLNESLSGVLKQLDRSKDLTYKNTISIHFEKHSGKQRGIQFRNFYNNNEYDKVYQMFLTLLEEYSKSEYKDRSKDFLRAFGRKFHDYQKLFILAMTKDNESKSIYLKQMVKNIFEEYSGIFEEMENDIKKSAEADYIEKITNISEEIYKTKVLLSDNEIKAASDCLQEVEAIIGLLSFYNEKENR